MGAHPVDDGDFAGLGLLLADATFVGSGTPRTQHVTSDIAIEVEEQTGTAVARSYVTVLQALPDLPLKPVAAGRYRDRFERRGGQWRFIERHVDIRLVGDVSRHLRQAAARR